MAEIDLEELKRLVDAATADDEDQLSKRLISRGILRHDSIDHARRVLELEEERATATWQAYRDALSARNKAQVRVLELAAEVERLRLLILATEELNKVAVQKGCEFATRAEAAEAKLREIGREIIMISDSDAPSDELWIVINRILKLARP